MRCRASYAGHICGKSYPHLGRHRCLCGKEWRRLAGHDGFGDRTPRRTRGRVAGRRGGNRTGGANMNTATVNAVLDRTIELLQQGWCQHHGARTAEGGVTDAAAQDAVSWCIAGALWRSAEEHYDLPTRGPYTVLGETRAEALWMAAIRRVAEQLGHGDAFLAFQAVTGYNDDDRRSAEDAILTVKRAREE